MAGQPCRKRGHRAGPCRRCAARTDAQWPHTPLRGSCSMAGRAPAMRSIAARTTWSRKLSTASCPAAQAVSICLALRTVSSVTLRMLHFCSPRSPGGMLPGPAATPAGTTLGAAQGRRPAAVPREGGHRQERTDDSGVDRRLGCPPFDRDASNRIEHAHGRLGETERAAWCAQVQARTLAWRQPAQIGDEQAVGGVPGASSPMRRTDVGGPAPWGHMMPVRAAAGGGPGGSGCSWRVRWRCRGRDLGLRPPAPGVTASFGSGPGPAGGCR